MSLPKVRNSYALVLALAAGFFVQFMYYEWMVPARAAGQCHWKETGEKPTNVLLVADPQLIDNHTYPGRNSALLKLSQHTVDTYLAQNYKALVGKLEPDYIFFLGDYLDNGRSASDEYFNHEVRRFWRIFDRWPEKYIHGKNWFTNVAGNHDIGFGNGIDGVDFVVVDTPSYSAEGELSSDARAFVDSLGVSKRDEVGAISEEVDPVSGKNLKDVTKEVDALFEEKPKGEDVSPDLNALPEEVSEDKTDQKDTNNQKSSEPENVPEEKSSDAKNQEEPHAAVSDDELKVLLSHVPFYRDPKVQTCGPLRESPVFHLGPGYQYQSALSSDISDELLTKIRPVVSFTGDDHDYCDVTHPLTGTREITVKSISMAMGIWHPAVQLLSFDASKSELTYDTHLCYLPTPYANVISYAVTATVIAFLLLGHSLRLRPSRYNYNYSILPTHGDPESAILMENPMSKKVSDFLKEQDEGSSISTPIPVYTSTAAKSTPELLAAKYRYARLAVRRFSRKWNLALFLRLCVLEFSFVMLGYFIVIASI
ncbi:uncharacterized protein CXQ87_001629 [Candidozyma duobushaemuli]|uniref:Uncharacterized protein n=1 Tax=Candidozyma duobushaemuli TaxID=1231522 RepID=A0A2V1A7X7_9ASCO|nr:uncharacterized protein CXQ87_001629 [[Candida] duobushaemulonis]PVH13524.1 hypothetical protein CXQ87_001629 [[Candida] duobushaemulonis]